MGIQLSFPCFCWPWSHRRNPSTSSAIPEPDERTPLILDPPQSTAPPHPVPDLTQRKADEAAAKSIVDQTAKSLVCVFDAAPFSHFRVHPGPPHPQCSPEGSATTWRAYDPPPRAPVSPDVRRLRLGYDDPSAAVQPQKKSYHSLKTIINHHSPGPSGEDHSSRDSTTKNGPPGSSQSTQFHSIRSFQTVDDSQPERLESLPERTTPTVPEFVTNIWPDAAAGTGTRGNESGDGNDTSMFVDGHEGHLTDDPVKLGQMLRDGYELMDTGPIIVVDL